MPLFNFMPGGYPGNNRIIEQNQTPLGNWEDWKKPVQQKQSIGPLYKDVKSALPLSMRNQILNSPAIPMKGAESNPIIGQDLQNKLFLTTPFPVRQNDNIPKAALKSLGNFAFSLGAAPGELARKAAMQFGSVASGNGIATNLPKNTSFIGDILPRGISTKLQQFEQSHPVAGGIGNMLLETAVDPTTYITGSTVMDAFKPKTGFEQAAQSLGKIKLSKADLPEFAENANEDILKPLLLAKSANPKKYTIGNPSLTKSNLYKTADSKIEFPETTIDLDIPLKNGKLDPANVKESYRTADARIEKPSVSAKIESPKLKPQNIITGETAESFRSKIDRNPVKGKPIMDTIRNLRTQFVDDLAPLENLEKKVTGKVASAESSLYKQGRLFRGNPEKAHEFIQSKLTPVIKQIEKAGYTYKDLGDYALAVHAKDVNAKGIVSGFSDVEIDAVINKFGTPKMENARQQLMKLNDNLLNKMSEGGLINKELVKALKEKHPNYMPLFRSFDDEKIEFTKGLSKTLANASAPIERLKGSTRNVIDPMESLIKNTFKITSAVDRNNVATKLGSLADLDTKGEFVRRLAEGEERSRLNAVYAMENGKKVYYEVQPDVYKSIMNLDKESSSLLIKILQKPASLLRAGATLTPEFSFRNPMRDVPAAFINSKSGFNPLTDVPRSIIDIIKSKRGKESLFNDFLRNNGGYGNIVSMDRKVQQQVVNDMLKQSASKKFVNVINGKSLVNVLRSIADFSETATKLGEYRAAIRQGQTKAEAAYRARDLMDFGRAGTSIREANKVVAFLNANIQGKSKLFRSIKENPVGVTVRAVSSLTLPTIGAFMTQHYLANDEQKQTISDAPDWLKDNFWLVPVPGTSQVARIPKPFDLAPVFANLPEKFMQYIIDKDPNAFDDFARRTMASYSIPTMLTGLMPFVEGMANYSFFQQAPIIPQRENDLNFPDQYDIKTSETAKFLGKGINKITGGEGIMKNFGSPRVIDNTIRGLTGGLGTYATSAIDLIVENTGIVKKEQKPAKNLSEYPLAKAFLVNTNTSGQSLSKLYDLKDKLTREKGSATANQKTFNNLGKLKAVEAATKEISEITKEMRKIENGRLSPKEKREKMDLLNKRRNEIAINSYKQIK